MQYFHSGIDICQKRFIEWLDLRASGRLQISHVGKNFRCVYYKVWLAGLSKVRQTWGRRQVAVVVLIVWWLIQNLMYPMDLRLLDKVFSPTVPSSAERLIRNGHLPRHWDSTKDYSPDSDSISFPTPSDKALLNAPRRLEGLISPMPNGKSI